jgi:hypothetical protein
MTTRKFWILNICFLSLFTNTIHSFMPGSNKLDYFDRILIAIAPCYLGAVFLLLGSIISIEGENRQNDMPTTDAQRHFYVMRNYLPKEDLDKIKEHDQKIALKQIKWGKNLYNFGLLCIAGGITGAFYDDISNIFKYLINTFQISA